MWRYTVLDPNVIDHERVEYCYYWDTAGKPMITVVIKEKKWVKLFYKPQDDNTENEKSKEEYIVNYLKSMIALEEAMEPYKEQKKELRRVYRERLAY